MKVIIEVGSTNTKIDLFDGSKVKHLGTETIEFKRNYKKENKLNNDDVVKLISIVKEYVQKYDNVYVCGTSIFRNLAEEQKKEFLDKFYSETNVNFDIISPEKENELTVFGTVRNIKDKVAVFIGGGGSTEIAIYDGKITETVNSGIRYEKNTLFEDELAPIMMDIKTRKEDTLAYYEKISLDEIRKRVDDPNWWYATRAMCAFVLNVAEMLDVKYIVPTDISMVYGLLNDNN